MTWQNLGSLPPENLCFPDLTSGGIWPIDIRITTQQAICGNTNELLDGTQKNKLPTALYPCTPIPNWAQN
jgi:hypothetical protein